MNPADTQHTIVDQQIQQLEVNLFQTKMQVKMMEANLKVLQELKESLPEHSEEYQAPTVNLSRRQPPQRPQG